ncbi:MAG: hypothetical protein H0U52_07350 [Chloroflexi bacterium]|nr:hypothetical protein [Chloroflexota bacterium]
MSVAACGVVPGPTAPPARSPISSAPASVTPSTPGTVSDAANGISFEHPAGWTRSQPNQHNPINDGPLIYLSTDPLLSACATAAEVPPNPPDAQGRACDWPLTTLSPNGVFVDWLTTRILQPLPSVGEPIAMNGDTARLQIERPGSCERIGATETISVLVPIGQPKPWSNVAVIACVRGPDLATAEAQVRAMLASAIVAR